jgi:leader peptidase (prepilin peptidase)/N-methyltransferase
VTLPPFFLIGVIAIVGLIFGSFFNVCIARLPRGESVITPPSHCPRCNAQINWYDNVPILSYILLGGKCRTCKEPISLRYPMVEGITAIAFALQAAVFLDQPVLLASRLVLTSILIVLFGTDFDTQRLPDVITKPAIAVGVLFNIWTPPGLVASVIGAVTGAGVLLAVRWLWRRLRGVDGMGLGDVKMLAGIGAFLGWRQVWVVLFLASLSGAVIGIALASRGGRSMQTRLPFGTFLALAAFAASLFGERLLSWYLGFY